MRAEVKIKELEEKIHKKAKELTNTINTQISHKKAEFNSALDRSIKKEKLDVKKATSKFLEHIESKVKEQTDRMNKLRTKIHKVTAKLEDLERRAKFKSIEEIKRDVEEDLKKQYNKYEKLKDSQKVIYQTQFDNLNEKCIKASHKGFGKLKKLL